MTTSSIRSRVPTSYVMIILKFFVALKGLKSCCTSTVFQERTFCTVNKRCCTPVAINLIVDNFISAC